MKKKFIILIASFALIICCAAAVGQLFFDSEAQTPQALTSETHELHDPEIEGMIASMSIEKKVGQMFMGCFYNGTPDADAVADYNLGAVLLFSASFTDSDKEAVKNEISKIKNSTGIEPFIAVDEEGGTVNRVSSSKSFRSEPFDAPGDIYTSSGMEGVIADIHEKNDFLTDIGITLNLAPVCDISLDPDDFMYERSLRQDAETTAEYARLATEAYTEDNIGSCLKHFPGYGNSADTHEGIVIDDSSLEDLEQNDLLPFESGIKAGTHAILVSHNIVTAIDDSLPASLSPAVHNLLRYDMGFDGVIITDDLSMNAISEFLSDTDSAVAAIQAGNDMLCTGDFARQEEAVLEAVNSGIITEARIDSSVRRILMWKKALSLL